MKQRRFHHPRVSLGVLRRTISADIIDLICLFAEVVFTPGQAAIWNRSLSSRTSYRQAVYRLRKTGLLAFRRSGGQPPELRVTSTGRDCVSEIIFPERLWNQKWDGTWYLLMYDIPENQRRYRSGLRHFLARQRLGGLQKSIWISARDIRPLFHDLRKAAAIDDYAYLFEAQTVLGLQETEIAAQAWNFDRLNKIHTHYIEACVKRMTQKPNSKNVSAVLDIMRHELDEYTEAMRLDPLLPSILWPPDYEGPNVAAAFRRRIRFLATYWLTM